MVRVTALAGRMRSGKSTIAQHLIDKHGYEKASFAQPLKDDIHDMGFPQWAIDQKPDWMRKLMQSYGQARRALDTRHWVDRLVMELHGAAANGENAIVIDDLRYENEAQALRNLDPYLFRVELVRVFRIGDPGDVVHGNDESEHALDYWEDWDHIVQAGSGDVTGLLQSVEKALGLPLRS